MTKVVVLRVRSPVSDGTAFWPVWVYICFHKSRRPYPPLHLDLSAARSRRFFMSSGEKGFTNGKVYCNIGI